MDENDRSLPVDAVRGIAMFFIGVSHIRFYLIHNSDSLASLMHAVGFLASPSFLLMSGLACGYQLARSSTATTALRIVDRGLFAFLVGHLLVAGSLVYMVPAGTAFEHVVITDTIGVLLCMAPILRHTPMRPLLWAGSGIYLLSSAFALSWHPHGDMDKLAAAVLFAVNDGSMPDVGWVTPTIEYLGIFLIGTGLGKATYRFGREGRAGILSLRLAMAGSVAVAAAIVLNVSRHFLKPALMGHFSDSDWANVLLAAMNVRHDAPPTPAYGLFYCGMGIALLGFLGLVYKPYQSTPLMRTARLAAVIGRASFVSYVAQQWLIDFIPIWVGFDSWLTPVTAPVYLAATTATLFWIATIWGRRTANRYLTLGLKPESLSGAVSSGSRLSTDGVEPRRSRERRTARWREGGVAVGTAVLLLALALNLLVLANAPKLTPSRLALVPSNPYAWTPSPTQRRFGPTSLVVGPTSTQGRRTH